MVYTLSLPVFGELRWENDWSWWFTQLRLESGDWLDVIIAPGEAEPFAFLEHAAQLYSRAMEAERTILQEAIQTALLELYEVWRQADEPHLTAEELRNQLALTFVRIDTSVPVTLSYGLGDEFGGHAVDVQVDENLHVLGVNLVG